MTQEELKSLLDVLLAQWENEVVEFKRGGKGFSTGEIGEYFSALSNEANLACFPRAWLVFGVDNKTRKVVGTDYVDRLVLESQGNFYYGCPDDYITGECTPPDYRNPQLVDAMSELNMIDTMGYGIHRMYAEQAKRYMPLHDYLLTPQSVTMTIYGHFLDESYSSLLVKHPELRLEDVWLLDRVQKGLPISDAAAASLRKRGLVAGRKTKLKIVVDTGDWERTHSVGEKLKPHHQKLIDFLAAFPGASREKINEVMLGEIAEGVSESKKLAKITNVLTYLRRKGLIENVGTDTDPHWNLCKRSS